MTPDYSVIRLFFKLDLTLAISALCLRTMILFFFLKLYFSFHVFWSHYLLYYTFVDQIFIKHYNMPVRKHDITHKQFHKNTALFFKFLKKKFRTYNFKYLRMLIYSCIHHCPADNRCCKCITISLVSDFSMKIAIYFNLFLLSTKSFQVFTKSF